MGRGAVSKKGRLNSRAISGNEKRRQENISKIAAVENILNNLRL